MTIFATLNERFKASLQTQCLSTFQDNLDSVLTSAQNQSYILREFEVIIQCMFLKYFSYPLQYILMK